MSSTQITTPFKAHQHTRQAISLRGLRAPACDGPGRSRDPRRRWYGLADLQSIEAQQGCQSGMVGVVALGGEEEPAELTTVESTPFARVDLGAAGVLRRVRGDPAVDVGEAVEATIVDSRRSMVEAAGPRSSMALRHSPMCARLASRTSRPTSVHHRKNVRRS